MEKSKSRVAIVYREIKMPWLGWYPWRWRRAWVLSGQMNGGEGKRGIKDSQVSSMGNWLVGGATH